jgi:hypothetical protein
LIRILTLATLATSISAFAATDDCKPTDAATTSASSQQQGCAAYTQKEKKQKNAKSQRDDQRTEQEKRIRSHADGIFRMSGDASTARDRRRQ